VTFLLCAFGWHFNFGFTRPKGIIDSNSGMD